MSKINLMAILPQMDMRLVYEETYQTTERVVPKIDGQFTAYSILPMYSKNSFGTFEEDQEAGRAAQEPCQVLWLAADTDAIRAIQKRNEEMAKNNQLVLPDKPKLVI